MNTITFVVLVRQLDSQPKSNHVVFDFCGFAPSGISSYQGFYNQLALSYEKDYRITVAELLEKCRIANSQIFTYRQGGDFLMDLNTPVWVANYDEDYSTGIIEVTKEEYQTVIHTRF